MKILEKKRSEIEEQYKWDLTPIYKNDQDWYKDFDKVKKDIKKVTKYQAHIMDNASNLYATIDNYFKQDRRIERLHQYAHLNNDADTSDVNYQTMYGKIINLIKEFNALSSYIEPELLKSDLKTIKKYYKEEKRLKEYNRYFIETFRFKKHILSEAEEKMLSRLSKVLEASSNTYEKLKDTDMTIGEIKDEKGNIVELSDRNYVKYLSSEDRKVRINAFTTMYKAFSGFINTMASTMEGEIESNTTIAKIKHYRSAIECSLYSDNIDISVYNNLIETVNKNLNVLFKYYDLRKKVLKLEELHLYDLYTELIPSHDKEYKFEEGKNLVIESLKILGDDYSQNLSKAFEERWIDVYGNIGKRSGAYSSGGYDTHSYVLLNYNERLKDVSTLAHELGHSMHSYYSKKNNPYQESNYRIFVAEVASTVNELLLLNYMLKKSDDKEEKLTILNNLMELFKGTIYRQTMFAEFEKAIYEQQEKGEILTSDLLSDIYYDLNKKYFGPNVIVDNDIRYEWARIPHFYYFFYVYKYATGLSAACYIVDNILNNRENAIESYLEFLKTGGRDYPLEELKIAGVDMNNPKVIESAIKMFDETIKEFIKIYNK